MIIGNFQQQEHGYIGSIVSIGFSAEVRFVANPTKTGNGPDFVVQLDTFDRSQIDIGAAWRKTSKAGKPYLSVKLDGPMLAEPINCALTQQQDTNHALVWSRRDTDAETTA